jgi:transcription elongation factor GreA
MEMNYKLVAESEADLKPVKYQLPSPIGKDYLQKVGDVAEITVPNGMLQFEILDSRN